MMMQTTSCDVNIEKFPFDTQTCSIQLVYWGMNGIDVEANISSQVRKFAAPTYPQIPLRKHAYSNI